MNTYTRHRKEAAREDRCPIRHARQHKHSKTRPENDACATPVGVWPLYLPLCVFLSQHSSFSKSPPHSNQTQKPQMKNNTPKVYRSAVADAYIR
ncbi:hypothetical protein BO99DRAFT_183739 [Aspergillus violaceofuscus CBS 115571]|uniref:Uncharacterized protein n=1 Tax=Aspergillus violaceofuscus (strain CBS 115571) TaxID=1450538 RepID=A0A2V5HH01_ASPV1|nr:hypothetical protein BO99DRAFT_183739 [Aspergillus violaceofuscus CBS 115571]